MWGLWPLKRPALEGQAISGRVPVGHGVVAMPQHAVECASGTTQSGITCGALDLFNELVHRLVAHTPEVQIALPVCRFRPIDIFQAAARTSAVVMFLVAAAMVSAWLITVADLPSKVIDMLQPFMGNQTLLLIAIMVLVMVVGTAMDMTPTILILTPVLMPVVKAAGIDPVYFGVLFIINNAIGLITPPVGTVLNVVAGVGRLPMHQVIKGVHPFLFTYILVLALFIVFPQIVTAPVAWMR
eukprot:gene13371-28332_t